ncbi:MAG: 1,4-dihydroxy-2-naphthoate polyprenyltransferase [Chloroflexi bacterium GWB2_49_20]|nr:MAG: 1,4-dihydroxy-2-naphthoate polyprenyltransferase [Chloroflexi bacterium GWB2_49_20]OGN78991.1 MAG: 1,4-dihydroxy-2-naphthoate polyprenyltransferase [Chloroflexi bacterium GWC2_49_37]OGN86248.1 MAG: 1,4-dihydroxy-2-naphthoate polyprenyltransferase [Chloroflexi bacterium GWD2_49_16]
MNESVRLTKVQVWILAARPKTLPAAAASAFLGSAFAYRDGKFNLLPALAALFISLLLQIGANFANDLFDYQRGADTSHRLGPLRVTQAGLLTSRQVSIGMILVFGSSIVLGLYLAWVAGWIVILIGISAILAALAYTGGPFPFGYHSLGDLFVFIFFGFAAVCGTYFVQANSIGIPVIWAGFSMGLLITNILVVNNLRDIETDRESGKVTLAVRLGVNGTRLEYLACLIMAYATPVFLSIINKSFIGSMLTWLSIPLAAHLFQDLTKLAGRSLNQTLAGTARLALIYALIFSFGILFFH